MALLKNDMSWMKAMNGRLDVGVSRLNGKVDKLQSSVDKLPMKLLLGMCAVLVGLASLFGVILPWLCAWMG
ncbi:translation repressor antiviral Ski3 [Chlorella sorokiniana]|uniref:Translation repressor antiviral Ski3 n=1 Tax=Chlorella sorokiniana TaxID=3076 RepID=A0A2P6U4J2_CHLSO|nr:translation repressor antiviral Ski3 [Chlorella sorokiniana]|eukprot:PRW61231.1 translation repressor antiviral Ski3 [Chlorella sorokiniana]